uniref:Protein PERCC1 n=1 Tax=Geotrypetes seraphini TaxID=260995 RepID=A0A6P8NJ76_GEOSA|nr:protein PERCC1 [Geotrypetes seraphini]
MAAGLIGTCAELQLASSFQHIFHVQDADFQYTSEEEEEDEGEEIESDGSSSCQALEVEGYLPDYGQNCAEMTLQLLRFTELISCDIQRYFGKKTKEEDPDSCNIYEDHMSCRKSGREMYFVDLVRIAQNGDGEDEDQSTPLPGCVELDCQVLNSVCCKDGTQKLGPLAELFEYGLHRYVRQGVCNSRDGWKHQLGRKYAHVVPMQQRKLPLSFWKEPSPVKPCIMNTNTPDFSDLLANWTSETNPELMGVSREASGDMNHQNLGEGHFHGV